MKTILFLLFCTLSINLVSQNNSCENHGTIRIRKKTDCRIINDQSRDNTMSLKSFTYYYNISLNLNGELYPPFSFVSGNVPNSIFEVANIPYRGKNVKVYVEQIRRVDNDNGVITRLPAKTLTYNQK